MSTHSTAGDQSWSGLDPIEDIVGALRRGEKVIILDDEDRENEGDIIMVAAKARSEDINFMARYARGLICLTLTRSRCEQLRLPLMVSDTDRRRATNFTVSIEAADGITTGISAHDRARTIRAAIAPDARPEHLSQPGHVFPVMAQPGGVLTRAGHTEAGCDLARMAGFEPAAVIVEIMNDDGTMARRDDLVRFAKKHNLKIGTIADLIEYRLAHEESVEIVADQTVQTPHGEFRFVALEDHVNRAVHVALVRGEIDPDSPVLVRVHRQSSLADVFALEHDQLGWPLQSAMRHMAGQGNGVIVVLRHEETAREFMEALQRLGATEPTPLHSEPGGMDLRTFGTGAQVLRALGVRKMRVVGKPRHMNALSGFGLELVEYVAYDRPEDSE